MQLHGLICFVLGHLSLRTNIIPKIWTNKLPMKTLSIYSCNFYQFNIQLVYLANDFSFLIGSIDPFSFQDSWWNAKTIPLFSTQDPSWQHSACSRWSNHDTFSSTSSGIGRINYNWLTKVPKNINLELKYIKNCHGLINVIVILPLYHPGEQYLIRDFRRRLFLEFRLFVWYPEYYGQ